MNKQKRVHSEIDEIKLWMAGPQGTVLLYRSLVSTLNLEGRCFCFVGFGFHVVSVLLLFSPYGKALSRELRDVAV